jgi:hypothetical protein
MAAIPTIISAKSAARVVNFLCCISERNYWSPNLGKDGYIMTRYLTIF